MTEAQFYDEGLDLIGGGSWVGDTYRLLLCSGYSFDPSQTVVDDVSADELTGTGYARPDVDTPTRTVGTVGCVNGVIYDAEDPDFGSVIPGETATSMILYKFVTDDTDSLLVAHYPIDKATDGNPFVVALSDNGLAITRNPP